MVASVRPAAVFVDADYLDRADERHCSSSPRCGGKVLRAFEVNQGVIMKLIINRSGKMAATVAWMGMMLPPAAFGATPSGESNDVALRSGGVLVGQVVDQQGVAQASTKVSVRTAGSEVVQTTTDANGVFAAKGLRGGQYELATQEGVTVCRLWAADTAPPAARPAALVVNQSDVVRGQGPVHGWVDWMKAHPYLTAGVIAAGIAIPVALADDDFDNGS